MALMRYLKRQLIQCAALLLLVSLVELAMLANLDAASSDSTSPASYWVTVRQVGGSESIPAHMECWDGRICRGEMSVSVGHDHRRIFVTGMIDGLYAYFGFRSDRQALQCGPLEFITFQVRPLPAYHEDGLCDPPASTDSDGFGLRHPVLKSFPTFAAVRIDVQPRDNGNSR
jgi:hypothetical protein